MCKKNKIAFVMINMLIMGVNNAISGVAQTTPVSPTAAASPVATVSTSTAVAANTATQSLVPVVSDIPSTFTFRASCIKKTYVDSFYQRQLNEPALVAEADGQYTLYATCLNGLGVPVDTKIKLKIIIRNMGEVRTISIRSIVDASNKLRNCADVCNRNGVLECVPPPKK